MFKKYFIFFFTTDFIIEYTRGCARDLQQAFLLGALSVAGGLVQPT